MGILSAFSRGMEAGFQHYGQELDRPQDPPRDAGQMSPIKIGYYFDRERRQPGAPLYYYGERHIVVFGLNGAGKSTRFLIELLATLQGKRSVFVVDLKGELAYQTALLRKRYSDVYVVNPFNVLNMGSSGHNPLLRIPVDNQLFRRARAIADALIEIEEGSGAHWTESAQGLVVALVMYEVVSSKAEKRTPSLLNVRLKLTEAEEYETYTDERGRRAERLIKGLKFHAAKMVACGIPQIASLASRFVRDHGQGELSSIQSTADTQTRFLLDPMIAADLAKPGVDLRQIRHKPTSVYLVLPPDQTTDMRRWTRILLSSALSAHFVPGEVNTLFVMDEFRASVGRMQILSDMWSLVRGYGVQLMPILQSAVQLKALFRDEWENYVAQAGLIATLGPPGDMFTAEWMSKRSGTTTVSQLSFNSSVGTGGGDSLSQNSRDWNSSTGQSSNRNKGGSLNMAQVQRPAFLPQELMDIETGHGRIWVPGMGSKSIPFFAPPYWRRKAPWVKAVQPNPYYRG
ncbi:MAG: type IV secretory system conjugative DNA transfer family protein [Acetobacteraceae bacterium]|uniref:type IV secretory system conjugative DNA transfer family protein n=1 Tax=Bradyrhizobium sp. TaxID=376 RepID=UPI003D0BDB99